MKLITRCRMLITKIKNWLWRRYYYNSRAIVFYYDWFKIKCKRCEHDWTRLYDKYKFSVKGWTCKKCGIVHANYKGKQ